MGEDLKYKVGDSVRIKSIDWYNKNKNEDGDVSCGEFNFVEGMKKFCSETLTISEDAGDGYLMLEDYLGYVWTDEMIEGLVEEEMPLDKAGQMTDFEYEGLTYTLPEGYIFKDENGNVINATKIVLEKEKKGYPKTYRECCDILDCSYNVQYDRCETAYESNLHDKLLTLRELLICRDAYWKIAGDEMGLDKPWEPNWGNPDHDSYPTITRCGGKIIRTTIYTHDCPLSFPTEEMRDAFFNAFRDDIEKCKELI